MATKPAPTLDEYLDLIFDAAQAHGEDDITEHEVGDLQGVLVVVWKVLTDEQKARVVASDEVAVLLEEWSARR